MQTTKIFFFDRISVIALYLNTKRVASDAMNCTRLINSWMITENSFQGTKTWLVQQLR
jgi:hypothetical protein